MVAGVYGTYGLPSELVIILEIGWMNIPLASVPAWLLLQPREHVHHHLPHYYNINLVSKISLLEIERRLTKTDERTQ